MTHHPEKRRTWVVCALNDLQTGKVWAQDLLWLKSWLSARLQFYKKFKNFEIIKGFFIRWRFSNLLIFFIFSISDPFGQQGIPNDRGPLDNAFCVGSSSRRPDAAEKKWKYSKKMSTSFFGTSSTSFVLMFKDYICTSYKVIIPQVIL